MGPWLAQYILRRGSVNKLAYIILGVPYSAPRKSVLLSEVLLVATLVTAHVQFASAQVCLSVLLFKRSPQHCLFRCLHQSINVGLICISVSSYMVSAAVSIVTGAVRSALNTVVGLFNVLSLLLSQ